MNNLKSSVAKYKSELFVFLFYVSSRIHLLGFDIFNTDVWKWKARIFNFGNGVFTFDFAQTIQRYHPGVSLMWLGSFGVKIYSFYYKVLLGTLPPNNNIESIFYLHFLQKLVITLVIALTSTLIFNVLKQLFTQTYAIIFVFLLTFEPFFIALTRTVHLEGLMTIFMLASFVYFYSYLVGDLGSSFSKNKSLGISAFFAAAAILTKTSALFLLPFYGLILVLNNISLLKEKNLPFLKLFTNEKIFLDALVKSLKQYFPWLGLTFAFFILLWPAVWVVPGKAFTTLFSGIFETGIEEGHGQIYFGNFIQDPGVLFYLVVYFLRSSVVMLFGVFTYAFVKPSIKDSKLKDFTFYALLFTLFYVFEMTIPSKKLDRYILPAIAGSIFIASTTYYYIYKNLALKTKKTITILFISLVVLPNLYIHPDYFSYYNPIFGGLQKGIKIIEPKWLIGGREITNFFEHEKEKNQYEDFPKGVSIDSFVNSSEINNKLVIGFPEKYYTQIWPFIEAIGARATIKDITAQATNTKYFVYPVWNDTSNEENRFDIKYADSISVRGVEMYRVYIRQ